MPGVRAAMAWIAETSRSTRKNLITQDCELDSTPNANNPTALFRENGKSMQSREKREIGAKKRNSECRQTQGASQRNPEM